MRIKHYSLFNSTDKFHNWSALRNDESEAPYFLPYFHEEYLKKVDTPVPSKTTEVIIKQSKELGIKKIFSIGCGIAAQEYEIKKFSELIVMISDYDSSVLRIKNYNIFDNCFQLDAFKDVFPVDESFMLIFPRIDTEFDDAQLKMIFEKCKNAGIKYIWFIPAELLSVRIIIVQIKVQLVSLFRKTPKVFWGYSRSKSSFEKIWGASYKIIGHYKTNRVFFLLQLMD